MNDATQQRIENDIKEAVDRALAEQSKRIVENIRKAIIWKLVPNNPRMIMCNDKEFDALLSSQKKPLTDKE